MANEPTPKPTNRISLDELKGEFTSPRERLFFFLFPFVVTGALLGALYLRYQDVNAVYAVLTAMLTTFFFAGKFAVLAALGQADWVPEGIPKEFLNEFVLAGMVIYMDFMTSLLIAYNLDLLYRVPFLGSRLRGVRESTVAIVRAHSYLRKMAFVGVALFVAFPLTGTGAIGGTFVGKLAGLRRRTTLFGIALGSVGGSLAMAFGVRYMERELAAFLENPLFVLVCIAVLIFFLTAFGKMMFSFRYTEEND